MKTRFMIAVFMMMLWSSLSMATTIEEDAFQAMLEMFELEESETGSVAHHNAHLATVTPKYKSSIRMVNIFWEDNQEVTFYTHRNTKKVNYLLRNPFASMNIWLPATRKQITIDGKVSPLKHERLEAKWSKMPRWMQLKFMASDHRSIMDDQGEGMRAKLKELNDMYPESVPMPDSFVGYALEPKFITFYEVNMPDFATKKVAEKKGHEWLVLAYQP